MHRLLHTVTLRRILVGVFFISLACLVPCALGQSNVEADLSQPENLHNLRPLGGFVRVLLCIFGAALLILVGVLTALRSRGGTNLYKAASDAHWDSDARADAGERVDAGEVIGACAVLEHAGQPVATSRAGAQPIPVQHQARLFTPASGAAWGESMLKAFLSACMKVNCLGRTWREAAERQAQPSKMPDPREAELIRRLMQRWQEFHVDPDTGVFLEHSSAAGKSRVCIIGVTKEKHTLVEAAFNAGFVIESVGRYLRNTDLVYPRGPGEYHAPTKDELAGMTPGEKDSMVRITEIPDPWQAMIAGHGLFPRGSV